MSMSSIGASAMNGGMDVNSMVTKVVDAERIPQQQRIDSDRMQINTSLSAYGRLRESLDNIKTLVADFRNTKGFATRSATSSDEKIATAIASSQAIAGKYNIEVKQLAQSHKLASAPISKDTKFAAGQLQIALNGNEVKVNIRNNNSLSDIVRSINEVSDKIGIRASVINDMNGQRLIVASNVSGKENQIRIHAEVEDLNNPLRQLEFKTLEYRIQLLKDKEDKMAAQIPANAADTLPLNATIEEQEQFNIVKNARKTLIQAQEQFDTYNGMTQLQAAQDSLVILDNIAELSSSNNSIENAIDGVNLNLTGVSADSQPMEISIDYDLNAVREHITDFVAAYNNFFSTSQALSQVDPVTGQRGPLSGDSTIRGIDSRLKSIFVANIAGAPENMKSLVDFGVSSTRTGMLEINNSMLERQLNNNFTELTKFFGGNDGFSKKVEDSIHELTGMTGAIRTREQTLYDQNMRLNTSQTNLDRRMQNLEDRTSTKFAAMQEATGKMQEQLSSLMNAFS